jgi:hypothetical protein
MYTTSTQEPSGTSDDARRDAREALEQETNASTESVLARPVDKTVTAAAPCTTRVPAGGGSPACRSRCT